LRALGADRVNRSVVQNWRTRGIAWRYRPAVADLLRKARHAVPADFLAPHENKDAA
jgi:hypothetical protein